MEAINMRRAVTGLVLAGMLLAGGVVAQQKRQQEIDLQAAIRSETVDGDLKGAIKQYGAIVAKYTNDRAVTAMALVHMAEWYQKLGDTESPKRASRLFSMYGRPSRPPESNTGWWSEGQNRNLSGGILL
jgi:hypothetical protein